MVLTFTKIYYYRGILLILGRFNINGFKLFFLFAMPGAYFAPSRGLKVCVLTVFLNTFDHNRIISLRTDPVMVKLLICAVC